MMARLASSRSCWEGRYAPRARTCFRLLFSPSNHAHCKKNNPFPIATFEAVSHRPGGVRDEGLGKDRARLRMNLVGQPPPHASTRAPSIRIYLITREPQISSNGVQFLSALKAKTHAAPRNPPRDCEQIIAEPVVRETDLNAGTLDWDNTPLILRSKSRSQERG